MKKIVCLIFLIVFVSNFSEAKVEKEIIKRDGKVFHSTYYYNFTKDDMKAVENFLIGKTFTMASASSYWKIRYISKSKLLVCFLNKRHFPCGIKGDWHKAQTRNWGFFWDKNKKAYRLLMNDETTGRSFIADTFGYDIEMPSEKITYGYEEGITKFLAWKGTLVREKGK